MTPRPELELLLKNKGAKLNDDGSKKCNQTSIIAIVVAGITAVAGIVGCVTLVVGARSFLVSSSPIPLSEKSASSSLSATTNADLTFKVHDAYGEAKYGAEHPFIGERYVAETFKIVTLTAVGQAAEAAVAVEWRIDPLGSSKETSDPPLLSANNRRVIEATFQATGPHIVTLTTFDKAGVEVGKFQSEIISSYGEKQRSFSTLTIVQLTLFLS